MNHQAQTAIEVLVIATLAVLGIVFLWRGRILTGRRFKNMRREQQDRDNFTATTASDVRAKLAAIARQVQAIDDRSAETERWQNGFLHISENVGNQLLEIYSKLEGVHRRLREIEVDCPLAEGKLKKRPRGEGSDES